MDKMGDISEMLQNMGGGTSDGIWGRLFVGADSPILLTDMFDAMKGNAMAWAVVEKADKNWMVFVAVQE